MDRLSVEIERCQSLLDESCDQMLILCELEISVGEESNQTILDMINAKYTAVMGYVCTF